jgi:hypothetical protein
MTFPVLRRLVLLTLVLLLLSATGSDAAAAPRLSALPIDQYWTLVESSHQTIHDLKGKSTETIRAALDDLAAQWQAVTEVQLASGETIPLDNGYILSALRAESPNLTELTKTFDSLLAAHTDYPDPRFTNQALQPLKKILARPEFQWQEEAPNPINEWFQKLWDRFAAWLDKLFPDKTVNIGIPGMNLSIWTWLTILLLVLILAYVFRGLFADLVAEAKLNGNGDADEVLTADSAFERAQTLSRGGDYRAAVRYLYLSSLLLLDERGLLRYDRTRTNHEVLRTVSEKPELAQPLSEVIDVFDNVWYGYHELDEDRFKHYSDRVEELKEKKG